MIGFVIVQPKFLSDFDLPALDQITMNNLAISAISTSLIFRFTLRVALKGVTRSALILMMLEV